MFRLSSGQTAPQAVHPNGLGVTLSLKRSFQRGGVMPGSDSVIRRLGRPGDLGWVVMAHGELYDSEFGLDTSFEALVARIVADYANDHDDKREAAWIAELDGRRVGCVFCVAADELTAQLRILLVDECMDFARQAGYQRMKLWTNHPLVAARHIYLSRGFELTEQEPHRSFGAD